MDERELAELISRELDKDDRKPRDKDGGRDGRPGGSRPTEGFEVDAVALDKYARDTAALAGELRKAARAQVGSIRGIADDSFGRIGRDSGFATALTGFATALRAQVDGVADNAAELGRATGRTADAYQHEDDGIAADFTRLLG